MALNIPKASSGSKSEGERSPLAPFLIKLETRVLELHAHAAVFSTGPEHCAAFRQSFSRCPFPARALVLVLGVVLVSVF